MGPLVASPFTGSFVVAKLLGDSISGSPPYFCSKIQSMFCSWLVGGSFGAASISLVTPTHPVFLDGGWHFVTLWAFYLSSDWRRRYGW